MLSVVLSAARVIEVFLVAVGECQFDSEILARYLHVPLVSTRPIGQYVQTKRNPR